MNTLKIGNARSALGEVYTGQLRRLFYPAAGDDVGTSMGLFWNVCDSFYLIDPEYGKGISYDTILESLPKGARYMEDLKVEVLQEDRGYWEGAHLGRRYHVYAPEEPWKMKRLCFAACGTREWLNATRTHYNVVVLKDYAGFDGRDADFPYEEAWGRLNRYGIFAETIGAGRTIEASNFASYRFRGFQPLFRVCSNGGEQIGFGDGLCLFQKTSNGDAQSYARLEQELGELRTEVQKVFSPFAIMADYSPAAIEDEVGYEGLYHLMTTAEAKNWYIFSASPAFREWFQNVLESKGFIVDLDMLVELLAPLRMDSWGGW